MRLIEVLGLIFVVANFVVVLLLPKPRDLNIALGWALYAASIGLFWWSVRTTRDRPLSWAFSWGQPDHLVVTGPYRLVRHPFYSSYLCAWVAGVLTTAFFPLVVCVVLMAFLYLRASECEERKFLETSFKDEYADYKAKTAKFVPLIFLL